MCVVTNLLDFSHDIESIESVWNASKPLMYPNNNVWALYFQYWGKNIKKNRKETYFPDIAKSKFDYDFSGDKYFNQRWKKHQCHKELLWQMMRVLLKDPHL